MSKVRRAAVVRPAEKRLTALTNSKSAGSNILMLRIFSLRAIIDAAWRLTTPSLPGQFRGQLLIHSRALRTVSQFPGGRVDRARHLLHLLEVDLLDRVRRLVVILVLAIHVKEETAATAARRSR